MMVRTIKSSLLAIFILGLVDATAQNDFSYKRPIADVETGWNQLSIPKQMFSKIKENYGDIRIYSISPKGDTVEAPYLIKENKSEIATENLPFDIINTSSSVGKYYYTIALEEPHLINEIFLSFDDENFDWKVDLEGSADQQEWFTVLTDYRIVSIKNKDTSYEYTTLKFPDSQYAYFRIRLTGPSADPSLNGASISTIKKSSGKLVSEDILEKSIVVNKKNKTTDIKLSLKNVVPVSHIELAIGDSFDYYRPFEMRCVTDSFETQVGWQLNTRFMTSGVISSLEKSAFNFEPVFTSNITITISNHDNPPLAIDDLEVGFYSTDIIFRADDEAEYFLVYGNKKINKPRYDVTVFSDRIPEQIREVQLGEETVIPATPLVDKSLLKNKLWLWLAICGIMAVLGYFTIKMMRS